MTRRFLLLLLVLVASCDNAHSAPLPQSPSVYVDAQRHVVCYSLRGPQLIDQQAVAISCLPLDSTNSYAIGRTP